MNPPLVFRPEARDEIDEAYAWYEHQRAGLGEEFLSAIRDVLDRIQETPEAHAQVYRDVRRGVTRRFPYGVFYRVEADRIVVLAVYHSRRDPRGWRDRA
jgi:plasmid stabilization system protein ParE